MNYCQQESQKCVLKNEFTALQHYESKMEEVLVSFTEGKAEIPQCEIILRAAKVLHSSPNVVTTKLSITVLVGQNGPFQTVI